MKRLVPLLACALALSACGVDPERAAERRADLNAKIFPNPADRDGIVLAFPLESGGIYPTLLVTYDPARVGRSEVSRRVEGFCRRQNSDRLTGQVGVKGEPRSGTQTLPNGQKNPVTTINYRCITRS